MRDLVSAVVLLLAASMGDGSALAGEWSKDELRVLRSLWIGSLPKPPPDPSNAVADDPRAAALGHRLFFDTRLSANGKVACATCHVPARAFTDGRKTSRGIGATARNAPTIIGAAYNRWFTWDGSKDSQWSQALGPLENPREHGMTRTSIIDVVRRDGDYRRRYTALFGALPARADKAGVSRAFANLGRAIAAYQRRLVPGPSRFDRYVAAVLDGKTPGPAGRLTLEETEGLRVFIADNQGNCIRCHSGPLFTDHKFHNIGAGDGPSAKADKGRLTGIRMADADPFNCLGRFSGVPRSACAKLAGAKRSGAALLGAFKTPTLRNLSKTAPYMHGGQFDMLEQVMWHYSQRPPSPVGKSELELLTLAGAQFRQLQAFLLTLDSPVDAPPEYLRPPAAPD